MFALYLCLLLWPPQVAVCLYIGISAQWQCEVQGLILDLCTGTSSKCGYWGMSGSTARRAHLPHKPWVALFQDTLQQTFCFQVLPVML